MRKKLVVSALLAAFTISNAGLTQAEDGFLHKHHQRFKQRMKPTPSQRFAPAPIPADSGSQEQATIPSVETTPPSPTDPSVPATVDPNANSNEQTTPNNNFPDTIPEGRFAGNNDVDMSGILANDRSGSPLSGPLNTIGDFFAPGGAGLTVPTAGVIQFGINGPFNGTSSDTYLFRNLQTGEVIVSNRGQSLAQLNAYYPGANQLVSSVQIVDFTPSTSGVLTADQAYSAQATSALNAILGPGSVSLAPITFTAEEYNIAPRVVDSVEEVVASQTFLHTSTVPFLTIAAPGSQLGRTKLTEQNSPLPRDRVFFDYSFFNNASISQSSTDVHRFAPGFEKTFFDKLCSFEMRVPMGLTLNSAQTFGSLDVNHGELGNIAFAAKGMLLNTENFVLTSGLGVQIPTADDNVVFRFDGSEAIRVANKQVRLLPYIATLHMKGDWFWQNYVQVDAAANGNDVFFNGQKSGVLQEQNFIYMDSSLSRWMYRDYSRGTGWALTGEAHYNRTLGDADFFNSNGFIAGTPGFEADIVNLTFGSTYVYGKTAFTTAYGTPVTQDRGFDGEFRFLLNRFF